MKISYLSPAHNSHMLAVIAADIVPRLILVFPTDRSGLASEVVATFVCPRKRKCGACAYHLSDTLRVNVGLVQRRSPVEVRRVLAAESPAPPAPHAFPEGPGP